MKQLLVIAVIATTLCSCSPATVEQTPTAISTATVRPTITPTIELPTQTATALPTQTTAISQCPKVGGADPSWNRYKPNVFEDLLTEIDKVSSKEQNPGVSFYIETSGDHQFPSCVTMEYTGKYREITEVRKFLIEAWSGIFGSERSSQIIEILKHEVLLTQNGQEYWFLVQEPLIPYMENELTINKPAIVFIIWAGSSYLEPKTDHIFIIGEFTKP